jgi:hypothetical protein
VPLDAHSSYSPYAIIGYLSYTSRYLVEARLWHWRHGYTTVIGSNDRDWKLRGTQFGDEAITCIGGKELDAQLNGYPGAIHTDIISLNCMSKHGLNIMFLGEASDISWFYTFLSQIRRKS